MVPDVDVLKCWAHENNIHGTLSVLCANQKVKDLIMNDMMTWGKQVGLKSFEQVIVTLYIFITFIILTTLIFLSIGKRHLFAPGSIFGAERSVNSNFQIATTSVEELLQTATGRYVHTS